MCTYFTLNIFKSTRPSRSSYRLSITNITLYFHKRYFFVGLRLLWKSTVTVPQLLQTENLIHTLCLMQFYPELTLVLYDKTLTVDRPSTI